MTNNFLAAPNSPSNPLNLDSQVRKLESMLKFEKDKNAQLQRRLDRIYTQFEEEK